MDEEPSPGMRHYVCYPSADPMRGIFCAEAWMARGYSVCMMLDRGAWFAGESVEVPDNLDFHAWTNPSLGGFLGYYREINAIVAQAFRRGADLVTAIGDDMLPPQQGAEKVARMYFEWFPDGFGILQGTGDMKGEILIDPVTGTRQHNAGRVCGSPTFGRGWFERAFGGKGPFGDYGFKSFYMDEMLQHVAHLLGVLWQEPSVTIPHMHWSFGLSVHQPYHAVAQRNWDRDKKLFENLKRDGFPGHEPLTVATKT